MRKLQDSILSLLVHLIILFNIERLNIGSQNTINLDTLVYILTVVAIILILTIKPISSMRQPVLLGLAGSSYFIVKLVFSKRPLIGGVFTYLSFTELGLFLVAVFLAQILAANIRELEQNAKVFSYANIRKLKPVQEANKEIEAEIYRSRRFHRPLSVIVLEQNLKKLQNLAKLSQNAQEVIMEQYFSVILAKRLASQLRETDLLLENDKTGRLVILSPDTGINEAQNLVTRLNTLAQGAEFSLNFGTATFPEHALAFEQLLAYAEDDLQERSNSHIKKVEVFKEI